MDTTSPPMTPIRQYMSPLEPSPTSSYREHLRRRTSSFSSSHHDRSPVSPKLKRFSNASQYSNEFSPFDQQDGGGMGNLADELDELDDDFEGEEDVTGEMVNEQEGLEGATRLVPIEGARDSGVDVSFGAKKDRSHARALSKSFAARERPPDEEEEEGGHDAAAKDTLSPELEDALNSIARMTSSTFTTSDDPLIPRTIVLLQDLGNQSNLEANAQRLTTSTNSMTSNLIAQTKAIQTLTTAAFFSPFAFPSAPLDPALTEETTILVETLLSDLPLPDPAPLQGMQKLARETNNVIQTLSQLTDTLQIGRHTTNAASRHLHTTQAVIAELRREREGAERARVELGETDWNERIGRRWCASECEDIVGGFERVCEGLRGRIEGAS